MSATSLAPDYQRNPFPKLLLLGLAFTILAISVSLASHAVERHGSQAMAIRNCLDSNGPTEVWKDRNEPDKYILVCQLDNGDWGMQIIRRIGDKYQEVTAFIRDNPTRQAMTRYLDRFATPYKSGLP